MISGIRTFIGKGENVKSRRHRAIEKAQKELDRYEDWKEWVHAVGGSLQKGKDGKLRGVMHIN